MTRNSLSITVHILLGIGRYDTFYVKTKNSMNADVYFLSIFDTFDYKTKYYYHNILFFIFFFTFFNYKYTTIEVSKKRNDNVNDELYPKKCIFFLPKTHFR